MNCWRLATIAFGYIAIFFSVVSVVAPRWLDNIDTHASIGLLQTSRAGVYIDISALVLGNTEVRTSFMFLMVGTMILIISAIVMSSDVDEKEWRSLSIGGYLAAIAGIFILLAAAIYANYFMSLTSNLQMKFDNTFPVAWISCFIAIVASVFTLSTKKPKKQTVDEDLEETKEKDSEHHKDDKPVEGTGNSIKEEEDSEHLKEDKPVEEEEKRLKEEENAAAA